MILQTPVLREAPQAPAGGRFDLSQRVVLVVGAVGGIGAALARGLAEHGATLALADIRDDGSLPALARRLTPRSPAPLCLTCDVTVSGEVEQAVARTVEAFGRVDVVFNLAFASVLRPAVEMSDQEFDAVVDTCLGGTFRLSRAVGRHMISQGTGGSVIHFTSIAAQVAMGRGTGAYAAAKAGINALVRELAVEWAPHRIRVNAIAPCQTRTPGLDQLLDDPRFGGREQLTARLVSQIPLGRLAEPEDLVGPGVFLASDASAMVTGQVLVVDGGYTCR